MHSEIFEMQRQVWKKDAEKNRRAHLRVTLSLGFLMCFEAVTSRVSVSVNPVMSYHAALVGTVRLRHLHSRLRSSTFSGVT